MPSWIDDWSDPTVILTVLVIFFSALMWVIKREVGAVQHEMQPNSGKSMRDAIDRIDARVERMESAQSDHIQWHLDHKE